MKAPIPLLLITVLQGVAGGMALAFAVARATGATAGAYGYAAALLLALIGGGASFTHIHHPSAGKYMLRGWRTSWLSREAVTTAWFIGALALEIIWLARSGSTPGTRDFAWATAFLGLLAMWVTAMVYATIPAMRSWYSPVTVLAMMLTGVFSGWMAALVFLHRSEPWLLAVGFGWMTLWLGARGLQLRSFTDARKGVLVATGTGLPRPPYRLQDTGTTKPPYRTQPQIAPELAATTKQTALSMVALLMIVVPVVVTSIWHGPAVTPAIPAIRAGALILGSFVDRWLFFRDATHSSRVWFTDQLVPGRMPARS